MSMTKFKKPKLLDYQNMFVCEYIQKRTTFRMIISGVIAKNYTTQNMNGDLFVFVEFLLKFIVS